MDKENDWNHFQSGEELPSELLSVKKLSRLQSHHPLDKIRRNLLTGIYFGIVTVLAYLLIIYYFDQWLIRLLILVVLCFNLFIIRSSLLLRRAISSTGYHNLNLLQELTYHRNAIRKWWKIQEQYSILVYPFATTAGFLIGGILGSGDRELIFMQQQKLLMLLGILIVILSIVSFFGARYIFRIVYEKHLVAIEKNIESLRSIPD